MSKFLYFISVLVIISSCKKDEKILTEPSGRSYAGLKLNAMLEYEVEKLVFIEVNDSNTINQVIDTTAIDTLVRYISGVDTLLFYIKDSIVDRIEDLEGDSAFVIYRYYSDERVYSKFPDSVWTAKFKHNQYLRTENNTPYAKLSFPVSKDKKWDINAHNNLEYDEVSYTKIRFSKTINTLFFDDVVHVEQENGYDSSLMKSVLHLFTSELGHPTDIKIRTEAYANNIGLIEKVTVNLSNKDAQGGTDSSGLDGPYFNLQNGFIEYQNIIDYK